MLPRSNSLDRFRRGSDASDAPLALPVMLVILVAAFLLFLLPAIASAFVPSQGAVSDLAGEVARRGGPLRNDPPPFQTAGSELAPFTSRYGGHWQMQRNELTGTLHMVLGSGVAWVTGSLASEADAERESRRFFADNPELLGVSPGAETLELASATHALGKWAVIFQQRASGLEVIGGRAHVVFTDGGRLMAFGSDCFPGVAVNPTPVLSAPGAALRAAEGLAYDAARDEVVEQKPVVLPLGAAEGLQYRLAHRVVLRVANPPGLWVAFVDAASGEILWRYNEVRTETVSGLVMSETQFVGYCDGVSILPPKNMQITVVGQGTTLTDSGGAWSRTVSGSGPFTVQAEFQGPWVNVSVYGSLPDALYTGTAIPGTPLLITWNDGNARHDERDTFYNVNIIHDKMKSIDPDFTGLDYSMPCTVARTDGYCPGNAWYDGYGINFCDSSGTSANTGEIGNVVYHEYGHGITHRVYLPYGAPGDLHEGNSDVVACYLEDTPIVGTGFSQGHCSSGIRDLDNAMWYPTDLSGEGHHDGQIIGAFHWEIWQDLRSIMGDAAGKERAWDLWHFGRRMGKPQTQPDQVTWTLMADDDDGDLYNGTPFYETICAAASHHGFSCPAITKGVMIAHEPLTSTVNDTGSYQVTATVTTTQGSVIADSVRLFYRLDGGAFTAVTFAPAAPPDVYQASIPAQPRGTEIDYYIRAVDTAGNDATHPGSAPYDVHPFDVAFAFDDLEVAGGWTVGAPDDDATGGIWVQADPVGTFCQPEDDHTPGAGHICFVTGNGTPGGAVDEADVDGGKTTLFSPVYNVAGAQWAKVKYYRWFNNYYRGGPGNDAFVADLSNDGGASWANAETLRETRRSWERVSVDVRSLFLVPGQLKMRFAASDYGIQSMVEAAVDDFEVLASFGGTAVATAPAPAGLPAQPYLAAPRPNPFNPQTVISYGLTEEAAVRLAIYDVRGALVRVLVNVTQPAGHYSLVWDGRGDDGRGVPAGVYFLRLAAGGAAQAAKLVLMP